MFEPILHVALMMPISTKTQLTKSFQVKLAYLASQDSELEPDVLDPLEAAPSLPNVSGDMFC